MSSTDIVFRWAEPEELTAVAELSARIFDAEVEPAESWIALLVEDIARLDHPQADSRDYAVAVDTASGRIVGAAVLFVQPWRIGRTTLPTGRPEVVVTDVAYRGAGIMRGVFSLLHRRSAELGHVAQSITGVPGVYRRLGYEYTHPLGDGRVISLRRPPQRSVGSTRFAEVTAADADELAAVLDAARPRLPVTTPQTARYVAFCAGEQTPAGLRGVRGVTARDESGALIAAFELARDAGPYACRVVAAAVVPAADPIAVLRDLLAREVPTGEGEVLLALGEDHELYTAAEALGCRSDRHLPDRWYVHIPDTAAFVSALRPELDARLSKSVFRRFTGALTIDLRPRPVTMHLVDGSVDHVDADPAGGERLFVRPESVPALLTGAVSVHELLDAGPETHGSALAIALAAVLFPRLASRTLALD